MKSFKLFILAVLSLFVGGLRDQFATANAEGAAGTHKCAYTKLADAAWTYQHCVVMVGTDADHVNLADGNHLPCGSTDDSPVAQGDPIQVNLLGAQMGTRLLTSAASIAAETNVYCDPSNPGYIIAEPGTAATYYLVGRSKAASVETSDAVYQTEVETCQPRLFVILAALTSTQVTDSTGGTASAANPPAVAAITAGGSYAQADMVAVKNGLSTLIAENNKLQADLAAITAALNAGGIFIKHL